MSAKPIVKSLENNDRRQQTKCLRVRLVNNLVPRHLVCVQQIEQTTNCAARDVHDNHSHRVAPALRVGVGGNPRSRLYRQTGLVGQRQVVIQVLITSRSQLVLKKLRPSTPAKPLDDLDVLWDRKIVTTIPISGIGYWDSLTSLGQNGFYVISFTVLHITIFSSISQCSTESAIRRTMIIGRS